MSKTDIELLAEMSNQKVSELEDQLETNPYLRIALRDMQVAREDERAGVIEVVKERINDAEEILKTLKSSQIITIRDYNCIILTLKDILNRLQ